MLFDNESVLELINTVTEFNDLSDFMKSPELDQALASVIKLIMKPDVPPTKAQQLIVQLQAIAAQCAVQATIYTTIKKGPAGSENAHKKNIYYTMSNALDRLVDALKYAARYGT